MYMAILINEALAKVLNFHVAANFSLRVFVFNALQSVTNAG